MASEDGARGQMSDLNAVGTAKYVGQRLDDGEGGNNDRGNIDQVLPTGITAKGQDVSSKDDFKRGVRGGMSSTRNESIARNSRR